MVKYLGMSLFNYIAYFSINLTGLPVDLQKSKLISFFEEYGEIVSGMRAFMNPTLHNCHYYCSSYFHQWKKGG